jgi:DNA polymerase/3'-5' exonuclease PolX
MSNRAIVEALLAHARELDVEGGQLYRARAYRRAALAIQWFDRPITELLATEGREALEVVPGIGRHLAYTIATLATTGEWRSWADRPRTRQAS